jgi:hypothetical protein
VVDSGPLLVAGGAVLGVATALLLRTRLPGPVVTAVLAAAGLLVGAGALMIVTEEPSPLSITLTLAITGVGAPLQARALLGPFGNTQAGSSGTVGGDRKGH